MPHYEDMIIIVDYLNCYWGNNSPSSRSQGSFVHLMIDLSSHFFQHGYDLISIFKNVQHGYDLISIFKNVEPSNMTLKCIEKEVVVVFDPHSSD